MSGRCHPRQSSAPRASMAPMREAEELGAPVPNEPALEFGKVMARMRRIRMRISEHHSVHELAALGIDIFFGSARFDGADALLVGDARLHFKKALIATGARPRAPDIPGLDETGYRTSATIFEMTALPKRLAVIGGGPLGCELAQAFCRLGSHVTIVQNDAEIPSPRGTRRSRDFVPLPGARRRGDSPQHHSRRRAARQAAPRLCISSIAGTKAKFRPTKSC